MSHRTFAYLPPGLVSPSAVADIKRVADWFPAAITDCFGFELELMQESSSADVAFICRRNSIGAHILGGTSRTALKKELLEDRVWANVRRFCRSWTADDATLSHNVTHIWAEMDMDKQHPLPHPSIFLGVPQNHPSHVEWLLPVLETFDYPASNGFLQRLEQIIQIRIRSAKEEHLQDVDHLCCGNAGRVDILLTAARHFSSAELSDAAARQMAATIGRAKKQGAFQLLKDDDSVVFMPGLFQGLSGIGYTCLRLADDANRLPSLLLME